MNNSRVSSHLTELNLTKTILSLTQIRNIQVELKHG